MLIVTLTEGDYVMIGDSICVHYDHVRGKNVFALGIDAPKDVKVLRGKLYEEGIAAQAATGDEEAQVLSRQLKSDYKERRRRAGIRSARREAQNRRILAGEIKPYDHASS